MRIFVSVASYRDPLLVQTLASCLDAAAERSRVSIGVVDQSPQPTPLDQVGPATANLRYLHLHHRYGRGPCFARAIAASLWQGEEFFLQVDSHTVFEPGWDARLIGALEAVEGANPRSILTTYPCPFEMQGPLAVPQPMRGKAIVLRALPDASFANGSPVLRFQGVPTESGRALPGFHIGAGCLFARGFLLQEVPIDPYLYFEGEEQNLAIRAWTAGWDILHPPDMPIYHLYHAAAERPVHWGEADDAGRPVRWWTLREQAELRLRRLLFDGEDLGAYGLGRQRSLRDYARFSGIDYPGRTIDHGRWAG